MLKEEQKWRLKTKSLWLEEGDRNTKYFHRFSSQRRSINNILEIRTDQGNLVISFLDKVQSAVDHFRTIFTEPEGFPITKIMEVIRLFPRLITDEMNEELTK